MAPILRILNLNNFYSLLTSNNLSKNFNFFSMNFQRLSLLPPLLCNFRFHYSLRDVKKNCGFSGKILRDFLKSEIARFRGFLFPLFLLFTRSYRQAKCRNARSLFLHPKPFRQTAAVCSAEPYFRS